MTASKTHVTPLQADIVRTTKTCFMKSNLTSYRPHAFLTTFTLTQTSGEKVLRFHTSKRSDKNKAVISQARITVTTGEFGKPTGSFEAILTSGMLGIVRAKQTKESSEEPTCKESNPWLLSLFNPRWGRKNWSPIQSSVLRIQTPHSAIGARLETNLIWSLSDSPSFSSSSSHRWSWGICFFRFRRETAYC